VGEVPLEPRAPDPLVLLLVGLSTYGILRSLAVPDAWHPWTNAALGVCGLAFGRWAGLGWAELGLARDRLRSGILHGLAVLGIIVVVLGVAVAVPASRDLFPDDGEPVSGLRVLLDAAVQIPGATVFPEEVVFRGVLLALLLRRGTLRRALLWHSLLFGLWHVPPLLIGAEDGSLAALPLALATVVATGVAGLGFAWLRLRSGSLIAPFLAHVGTNSTALVTTWIATR
jgi:membrane protease YdiL (CAAX protease family)